MRIVIFDYVEDVNGSAIYPDDQSFFKNTQTMDDFGTLKIWGEYYGSDTNILDFDPSVLPIPIGERTVYTMVEFLDKMPRTIRQEIRAEELAGTLEVLDWTFIVNNMINVDLNELPTGFVLGLEDMVTNPNISVNQAQVDAFLER